VLCPVGFVGPCHYRPAAKNGLCQRPTRKATGGENSMGLHPRAPENNLGFLELREKEENVFLRTFQPPSRIRGQRGQARRYSTTSSTVAGWGRRFWDLGGAILISPLCGSRVFGAGAWVSARRKGALVRFARLRLSAIFPKNCGSRSFSFFNKLNISRFRGFCDLFLRYCSSCPPSTKLNSASQSRQPTFFEKKKCLETLNNTRGGESYANFEVNLSKARRFTLYR